MSVPTLPFADRVALVTGGGSGIGRAAALALAALGARVFLAGRRPEALAGTAALAPAQAPRPSAVPADLARDADIDRLAETVGVEADRLDILVHAAGILATGTVADGDPSGLDAQLAVNVRGPWLLTRRLLPLIRRVRGQVVFVNSSAGARPAGAENGAYAASKHALRAVADALRAEENRHGIRVLSIYPGRTATAMHEARAAREGRPYEPEKLIRPETIGDLIAQVLGLPPDAEVTDLHVRSMTP